MKFERNILIPNDSFLIKIISATITVLLILTPSSLDSGIFRSDESVGFLFGRRRSPHRRSDSD